MTAGHSIARAWAFGRHIPPRKLARRLVLRVRHGITDRLGPQRIPAPQTFLHDILPAPLFAPREGMFRRDGAALIFSFVGREVTFADGQIDWTAPGPGAQHQLWRMNLAYMEYLEHADDTEFAELISQWLEANAQVQPGAWRDSWNSYALSIRLVVWLQQLARRRKRLAPEIIARISASSAQQAAYLARHLETDIGGNHLIKNIKALLWAGAAFEGADAQAWQALGQELLAREIAFQILPDGVHYERSPSYHAQVFADFLEIRAVLPAPMSALDTALERMAQATADLAHPDGFCAQFNDAGLTMAYSPGACLEIFAAQGFTRPLPRTHFAFRDAGYFGMHGPRATMILDCGPIAPDDLPAHGHGDVLSFELSIDGERVIVDQGVFEYVAGARRALSRTAEAHNTLTPEGGDQADFFGQFRVGRRPSVDVLDWCENEDGVKFRGCHDGFCYLPGQPKHVRRIEAGAKGMVLHDQVLGGDGRSARVGLLLHPGVTAERLDAYSFSLKRGSVSVLRLEANIPLTAKPAVWWPDMGAEEDTTRLVAEISGLNRAVEMRIEFGEAA